MSSERNGDASGEEDPDPVLTREERIEQFGREHVEHTEWWIQECDRVEGVIADVREVIENRDDARVTRRGTSTDHSGDHEVRIRITIAGEPWEDYDAE